MSETIFMNANEVAEQMGTSRSFAYKVIRKLNSELEKDGFLTIAGKVNREYFNHKLYHSHSSCPPTMQMKGD